MRFLLILIFLSSCALFKDRPSLKGAETNKLLSALPIYGEGRGRLSFEKQQYVFRYDAFVKEKRDWMFVATIPLHGEEILVLENLKDAIAPAGSGHALETRIREELAYKSMAQDFMRDLRSMNRFLLALEFGLERVCSRLSSEQYECAIGADKFLIDVNDKEMRIKKSRSSKFTLQLLAQNLTDSIFTKTTYNFYSTEEGEVEGVVLNLELFWK